MSRTHLVVGAGPIGSAVARRLLNAGDTTTIDEIASHGSRSGATTPAPTTPVAASSLDSSSVEAALSDGDVARAIALVGELDRTATSDDERSAVRSLLARTAAAVGEPVDVTETVRPLVEVLLTLRTSARAEKRWADSDAIRDGLAGAGVEVRDTADGVEWEVRR